MEKEILKKILEQLEQSGNDQLWILAGMFAGMLLINLIQAVYTSRIVDKYKNELKKQEVKFSVYNQIQIEKLSNLFELAHELKCNIAPFANLFKKSTTKITKSQELDISYENLNYYYSKHRYIFPQKIKSHFKSGDKIIRDFKFSISFLNTKNEIINSDEDEDRISNLELIEEQINGYNFKKGSLEAMLFCEKLKVLIEEHFEKIE